MPAELGIKSAFILAGGLGERLKPFTNTTPKVILYSGAFIQESNITVGVVDESKVPSDAEKIPIIWWNIELLRRNGVKRVVLGIGNMSEQIKQHFGDGKKFGIEIFYSKEETPLGTAGALKNAQKILEGGVEERADSGTFFMMNGDELKDFDLGEMLAAHRANNALATIALVSVQDVSSFGVAEIEGSKIKGFVEKPGRGQVPSNLINSGLYILEPEVFDLIPEGRAVSIECEVFPKVAAMGKLFGFRAEGQWLPTDDMQRYEDAKAKWQGFRLNR